MGNKCYVGFSFDQPMAIASRSQALRLTLLANDVLPEGLTWRIHEGYLKNRNRYKTLGLLQNIGEADLFIPGEALATAF